MENSERSPASAPAVSVIVPTYNRPHTLFMALQSLAGQTFRDFEVLVVNDAGEDPAAVVKKFSERLNIRLITHERNKGLAAARNTGITEAKGRYVAYLDDDDFYLKNHLAVLHDFLTNSDYRVAYTDAVQEWRAGDNTPVKTETTYSIDFSREALCFGNITPVNCVMHERACLARSGVFAEYLRSHEDWDLWLRLSRHYDFAHIPVVTCVFTTKLDKSSLSTGNKSVMRDTWLYTRIQGILAQASPPVWELERAAASPGRLGPKNPAPCACSVVLPFAALPNMPEEDLAAFCAALGDAQLVLVGSGFTRAQLVPFYEKMVAALPTPPLALNTQKDAGRLFAANLGGFAATGDWLIFLDQDAFPREGCFTALCNAAAQNPGLGALGTVLHFPGKEPFAGGSSDERGIPVFSPLAAGTTDTIVPAQLVSGHCLMVRRDLFTALGGFDPAFAPGHFADADLCLRLAAKGFPNAVAPAAELDVSRNALPLVSCAAGVRSLRLLQDRWRMIPDKPLDVDMTMGSNWARRSTLWPSDGIIPRKIALRLPPHLE